MPEVPDSLNQLSRDYAKSSGLGKSGGAAGVARDPLVILPSFPFRLLQYSLSPTAMLLSPILMRQLMWFLQRWFVSYIMPNLEDYSKSLSITLSR